VFDILYKKMKKKSIIKAINTIKMKIDIIFNGKIIIKD